MVFIDGKRPTEWLDTFGLEKEGKLHFHYDDPKKSLEILDNAEKINFIHANYHKREHLLKYKDKWNIIFVHAYPRDMVNVFDNLPELKRLQLNTNVDEIWYDEFLQSFKKIIWIGNNKSELHNRHTNITNIINFYEFTKNKELFNNIKNGKVGFASRAETRKCLHWMNGHKGYALTNTRDLYNLKTTTEFKMRGIRGYQWKPEIYELFMNLDWGIFHGASIKEPFGYSIFQSVDYGKVPIINKDWAPEVDYKYRASNKKEFDEVVNTIVNSSYNSIKFEIFLLKQYLKKFDNKSEWIDKVSELF